MGPGQRTPALAGGEGVSMDARGEDAMRAPNNALSRLQYTVLPFRRALRLATSDDQREGIRAESAVDQPTLSQALFECFRIVSWQLDRAHYDVAALPENTRRLFFTAPKQHDDRLQSGEEMGFAVLQVASLVTEEMRASVDAAHALSASESLAMYRGRKKQSGPFDRAFTRLVGCGSSGRSTSEVGIVSPYTESRSHR